MPHPGDEDGEQEDERKIVPGPLSNLAFFSLAGLMLFLFFFAERIWNALT